MGKPFGSVVIIGGGIVGMAIARELSIRGERVIVLEKETCAAQHQSGRNSGVIHAGPYYAPGSLKAQLCSLGAQLMVDYASDAKIPHEITGKLLLATNRAEIGRLHNIKDRADKNGVPTEIVDPTRIGELEPFASALAGLHVRPTGIIDYKTVAASFMKDAQVLGAEIVFSSKVSKISSQSEGVTVHHSQGSHRADFLINAAGLHSDRVARMAGIESKYRIIPFRGEYFELAPEVSHRVRGLIYPVPNPNLPFLGVHLTKTISGQIHAGPNAVLALAREGYSWSNISVRDSWDALSYRGFPLLAFRNLATGVYEMARSASRELFARDLRKLVPGIEAKDLIKVDSGVRAQAVGPNGRLVDDFVFERQERQLHILNAPSPAATASLAIAKYIVGQLRD